MHICFLTNEYPKPGFPHGGLGSFIKTLAAELVKHNVQVSIVGINYTENNEEQNEEGVRVFRIKKNKVKGFSWWFNANAINKKLKEIHKEQPIDVLESPELGLAFINKIKGIHYVIRLHGGHHFFAQAENRKINKWKGLQEKWSFKKADAFIAISKYVKSHTETYLSYFGKPIVYITNPINTAMFKPLDVNVQENHIVFAGTVCEKKGIRQLIQAFPIVKEKYPEATLEIYGRDWKYPDGSSYIKMLQDNELSKLPEVVKAIHFQGAITFEDIPLKYAQAAVCVFPSHMETLGLVAPEAMAMEKPVIFTNKGPGPEIIKDGITGLLCNPHDPKDIAEKIIWILNDKERARQMGVEARKDILERFELQKLLQKNIAFYQELIKNNRNPEI